MGFLWRERKGEEERALSLPKEVRKRGNFSIPTSTSGWRFWFWLFTEEC